LPEYIDRACRIALSGRPGPVLLDIPRDFAEGDVDGGPAEAWLGPLPPVARPAADPQAITRAAELLAAAERPVVIAGSGALWSRAEGALGRLANDFRLPVIGKGLGRGLVPEDMEIGFSWALAHPAVKEADVVMVAGGRMGMSIGYGAPPLFAPDARFIQIELDAAEIGRNRPVEVGVLGDCASSLGAIANELSRRHNQPPDPGWMTDVLAERLQRIDEVGLDEDGMVHPLRMARELAARLPEDSVFVGDGANCLSYFRCILKVKGPGAWMDQHPFGSMGVGLPLAIGVAAAEQEKETPRPVFLGTGDGAFGQYLGELSSASLHGLAIFIMVANDGGWGASRNITQRLFGEAFGVDMNHSRYDLVAQGLECVGELAETADQVGPAFERALAAVAEGRTALVNCLVDRSAGDLRNRDPHLQTVTFNPGFAARRG
jgi:acetolactate synthase-1/2/3 large subunit